MPRSTLFILATLVIAGALLITTLLGGIHLSRFSRFSPPSAAVENSETDFTPSIFPEFSQASSPHFQVLIPCLFYRHSEPDFDPHIYLNTIDNTESHGYLGKGSVTIESLTVRNEFGLVQELIVPASPRRYTIPTPGYVSYREDLGAVRGKVLELTVTGFVGSASGDRKYFTHYHRWEENVFTRLDFGLSLME